MTHWMSVPASRLHKRTVVWDDTRIRQATLFPFFDRTGAVRPVLIVDADSSELQTFSLDETRVRIPIWGPVRLDGPIERLSAEVMDQLAPLWHYDPWWLLKDARFKSQTAVAILKLTNCANLFEQQPADLLFSSCLSKLRKVRFPRPTQEYQSQYFRPEMLPTRESTQPSEIETRTAGWRLDPVW